MKTRTPERVQYLSDLLVTAIENYGYGSFTVDEYHVPEHRETEWFAVVTFPDPDDNGQPTHRVDLDTMAKGLGVLRRSTVVDDRRVTEDGAPLYFAGAPFRALMLSDRTNGDDGDYDVIGALAVVECAIFGRVVYS